MTEYLKSNAGPTLESGGFRYPYRPELWDYETEYIGRPSWYAPDRDTFDHDSFVRHTSGGGYSSGVIWDDAHQEYGVRLTMADAKPETQARELGATPEQLARLRTLIESERDSIRLKREVDELKAEVGRLSSDTILRYDVRILPMLKDLAELAERRNFCAEFDVVLDHIGAPDRTELIEPKVWQLTYRVRADRLVTVLGTGRNSDEAQQDIEATDIAQAMADDLEDDHIESWYIVDSERVAE